MRRTLLLTIFLAATAFAFNLGRRVPAGDGVAADTTSSSAGEMAGSVESSSRRSEEVRKSALRAIAGQDTYLSATLVDSDSILRRWVDRERRPLLVYFEPAIVSGYTAAIGQRHAPGLSKRNPHST